MTEYKPITRKESMALSRQEYIDRCQAWIDEFNDGQPIKVKTPVECPVHVWVMHNHQACCKDLVGGIVNCPICNLPMCPNCSSHNVTQLSRVTGYMGDVAGWNAGKKQELKERQHHNLMD